MIRLGSKESTVRTPEEVEIANFWSCFTYTGTPAGHWNDIARIVLADEVEEPLEVARACMILNLALADAGIAAWDCKYHYRNWRPIQAVHAVRGNNGWRSLLEAPPHPEYVSGHSAFTGAGEAILRKLLGRDAVDFEVQSDSLPDVKRRYVSLRECSEEIGRSRIYGGIHFSSANREGLTLGRKVGSRVWEHFGSSDGSMGREGVE